MTRKTVIFVTVFNVAAWLAVIYGISNVIKP